MFPIRVVSLVPLLAVMVVIVPSTSKAGAPRNGSRPHRRPSSISKPSEDPV